MIGFASAVQFLGRSLGKRPGQYGVSFEYPFGRIGRNASGLVCDGDLRSAAKADFFINQTGALRGNVTSLST
jgi:hypothetical protein